MDERVYIRDKRSPIPKNTSTSRVMSANKSKDTKPELIFRKALNKNGIKGYRLHWKKATGTPDIAFPGKKIAIFINGCFWHRCSICNPSIPKSNIDFWNKKFQRNIERDELKFKILKEQGWTVVVVWECQIRKDLSSQIENLSKFVKLDH